MTAQISDLRFFYLHKQLVANGVTPTVYTCTGAGTATTATAAALTEAADYWNGAVIQWLTGDNVGLWSGVLDFAGTVLTFDFQLPNDTAIGDTFRLFHGGRHVSDYAIPGLEPTRPVIVTGFSISYASMHQGAGMGLLRYHNGDKKLYWTPPNGTEGNSVLIGCLAMGETVVLFGGGDSESDKSKWVEVTRTAAALPASSVSESIALRLPEWNVLPPFIGAETAAGLTIYRAIGIQNCSRTNPMFNVRALLPSPDGSATTAAAGLAVGAGTLTGNDFSAWTPSGFVYNLTRDDCRYYYNRSGNQLTIMDPGAGIRGKTAVNWQTSDDLVPMPLFDIGLDPGVSSFADPASETAAPAGVSFSCPVDSYLEIGYLRARSLAVVWERVTIPAGFRPKRSEIATLRIYAQMAGES